MDGVVSLARKLYDEGKGFAPMFEVVGIDSNDDKKPVRFVSILGDSNTQNRRFEVLNYMGKALGSGKWPDVKDMKDMKMIPTTIFFSAELWMSRYDKEKGEEYTKDSPMPSEDPKRIEGFGISASTNDGKGYCRCFEIKREGGKIELVNEQNLVGGVTKNNLLDEFWRGYYSVVKKV
jgi:hypothetical protein